MQRVDQIPNRHRRNEIGAADFAFAAIVPNGHARDMRAFAVDADDGRVGDDWPAIGFDGIAERFPHHAGTLEWIFKRFNQRFDLIVSIAKEPRFEDRAKGKSANALRRPFRANLIARDTPYFFGVRFEKEVIELAPKAIRNIVLKTLFGQEGKELGADKAEENPKTLIQSQHA